MNFMQAFLMVNFVVYYKEEKCDMNKSDLEKIVAIAEEGSMAKAARRLYISQSTLSKCLARTEEELGEVLFVRRPNGVVPTYALPRFLKYAYQILHLYDQMSIEFCEINELRSGELKFGSGERVGAHVLPKALKTFHERYPNINIKIVEGVSDELEDDVSAGRLDIAITLLPFKNPNIQHHVFYRDPYIISLPVGHPLCEKLYFKEGEKLPYLDVSLLKGQDFVLTKSKKKSRQITNKLLDYLCGEYKVVLETNNTDTLIRFTTYGLGVALVPALYARTYNDENRIRYCQMEPDVRLYNEWAVIWQGDFDELTRPSRELFHIICDESNLNADK